jgi:enamine deaminase RidA (YjgF/YER057c/UK114 family)
VKLFLEPAYELVQSFHRGDGGLQLVVDGAGEMLDGDGSGERDGSPLEGRVVGAGAQADIDQRFDPGATALPVDVGVDAPDDAAPREGFDPAADRVRRQVDVPGHLRVAGAAVGLEETEDSHVRVIEAAVSAVIGCGAHPRPDYVGMSGVEARLRELEIDLPRPPLPQGAFAPGKAVGNLLFVSGAYGTRPDASGAVDTLPIRGRLGDELTVAEGQASARLVGINLLAMAQAVVGDLEAVRSVVRLVGYINAAPGFVEAPSVLDGASRLLLDVFGAERGSHARMALYQPGLPGGAPLTAELLLEIDAERSVTEGETRWEGSS